MALLTDRTLAASSAITASTLIHIVDVNDFSQSVFGSSYKAELGQLIPLFSGSPDTYVTGFTYATNTFTIYDSSGNTYPATINQVTGLTVNGGLSATTISATTYQNLPISGTHNYLSKFSSGTTILVDSQIRDDGTTVGLGTAPNANFKFLVDNSIQIYSLGGFHGGASGIGVYGQSNGAGNPVGIFGLSNGTDISNIGVNGQANNATTNIGLRGYVYNGINNYSIQLQDGTEGVGKVLTSVTSDGKANWQLLSSISGSSVISVTGITTSAYTATTSFAYYGVEYTGNTSIQIPNATGIDGFTLRVKDERGTAATYPITITPATGNIDGNPSVTIAINYMSLTMVARNNNWWII